MQKLLGQFTRERLLEIIVTGPDASGTEQNTLARIALAVEDGNFTAIPDGWKLVPIEPTENMIIDGFESEPNEFFSDEDVWEAYEAMSGCRQAAERARLCWKAMLAASPTVPEGKQ